LIQGWNLKESFGNAADLFITLQIVSSLVSINFIIIRIHSWNFSHPCDCLSKIDAKFMNTPQLIFPKQCWTMVEFVTHLRGFSQRIKFSLHFRYSFSKCKDSMKITFLLQGIQSAVSKFYKLIKHHQWPTFVWEKLNLTWKFQNQVGPKESDFVSVMDQHQQRITWRWKKPWLENSCQRFTMKMEIVWSNYFLGQDFYQHELRHNLGVF